VTAVASTGYVFPNIEFSMISGDKNPDHTRPNWAYDRLVTDHKTWLMPDFGLYAWPSHDVGTWQEARQKAREVEERIEQFGDKIPQLLWRGTAQFGREVREALLNETKGKSWSAVEGISWGAVDFKLHSVAMSDHCKYQYLAHTEGQLKTPLGYYYTTLTQTHRACI